MNIEKLIEERKRLLADLELVERSITDAQNAVYRMNSIEQQVAQRFAKGDFIVRSWDRYWWVDENGELIDLLSADDSDGLISLVENKIIIIENFEQ